jgi:PKD domain-containing protein
VFTPTSLAHRLHIGGPLWVALAAAIVLLALAAPPAGAFISGEFGLQTREEVKLEEAPLPLQYHNGPIISASDTYAIYWDPVGAYRSDWMRLIDRYLHDVGAASGQLDNVFSLGSQYTGLGGTRATYNSTFRGAYTDPNPYPANGCAEPNGEPVCLSDAQIRAELERFIAANALPKGIDDVYFVLTPPGVTVCADPKNNGTCSGSTLSEEEEFKGGTPKGICGYHSAIAPTSSNPIVYGVQPWVAGHAGFILQQFPLNTSGTTPSVLDCQNGVGLVEPNQTGARSPFDDYETGLADVIVNDLSIEQSNIVIDPLLNGWYQNGTNAEQADICQKTFSPAPEELPKPPATTHALSLINETINGDPYYLQWAFSSVGVTSGKGAVCWQGTELIPHFTAPNPVNAGDVVGFDAKESGMALDANVTKLAPDEPFVAPLYKWSFGDGSAVVSSTNPSIYHSYTYGGIYNVTLTVTDSGGNLASVTSPITVVGPAPPVALAGLTGASSTSGASGTGSTTGSKSTAPRPRVYETVPFHSLKRALHKGLAIRYAVNEQVAGSVEVMLDRTTARRLGIHGPTANNLPKVYPRSIVIGFAVLVTTRHGHGALKIKFSKAVSERLGGVHRVKLTLRIVVRNATRQHPKTTTSISTFVLKG